LTHRYAHNTHKHDTKHILNPAHTMQDCLSLCRLHTHMFSKQHTHTHKHTHTHTHTQTHKHGEEREGWTGSLSGTGQSQREHLSSSTKATNVCGLYITCTLLVTCVQLINFSSSASDWIDCIVSLSQRRSKWAMTVRV